MDCIQLKRCDIQGRLFERPIAYASEGFIRVFMNSEGNSQIIRLAD